MDHKKEIKETKSLIVKVADQNEFDQMHQPNHEIFADEISQHWKKADVKLADTCHKINTYMVALKGRELVGMVCYKAVRAFSLDKK